jgi:hypothetical protein
MGDGENRKKRGGAERDGVRESLFNLHEAYSNKGCFVLNLCTWNSRGFYVAIVGE